MKKISTCRENCIKAINEFFDCEELIYGTPWEENKKKFFINNQLEKRVFLYKFLNKKLLKKFKNKKSIKILEIGPSEGLLARMFRNDGFDINLLEYEKDGNKTVSSSKHFYPNINTSFCEFNKDSFPYTNNVFDIVISFGVIEHQEPPTSNFWEEMCRVLKQGGLLFVDNPNPHNLRKRICSFLGIDTNFDIPYYYNQEKFFTGHYKEHSKKELIYCLQKNMKLIDSGYFPFASFAYFANASFKKKIIILLYNLICKFFKSNLDTVYVIGQKYN